MTERFVSIEDVQKGLRDAVGFFSCLQTLDEKVSIPLHTLLEIIAAIEAADTKLTELAVIIDRMRQNWPVDLPQTDPSASRSS